MSKSILLITFLTFFYISGDSQSILPYSNGQISDQYRLTEDIKVFPNPAIDYIQISNVSSVKKIVIFDIIGKEIKSFIHYNNAQHDVSELKSGMYIIKMLNEKNKVIRTLKFNKNFSGA